MFGAPRRNPTDCPYGTLRGFADGPPIIRRVPTRTPGDVGHTILVLALLVAGYVRMDDRVRYVETVRAQDEVVVQNALQLIQSMQMAQATELTPFAQALVAE